jgi:hypothetical protein
MLALNAVRTVALGSASAKNADRLEPTSELMGVTTQSCKFREGLRTQEQ